MNVLKLSVATSKSISSRRLLCSSIKFHQQKFTNDRQLFQINNNSSISNNNQINSNYLLCRNLHASTTSFKTSTPLHPSTTVLNNDNPQGSADPYAPGITKVPRNALYKIFVAETLIFSVFGFFDNFIMMVFGDRIDCFFGDYITHPIERVQQR